MRISFTLVFLILLVAQAPLFAQAPSVEAISIEFHGNEAFPEDSLARTIVNRETKCRSFSVFGLFCPFGVQREVLNERELSRDILRLTNFYNIRGYREARIDTLITRPSEDVVELSFQIDEGPPVRIASLTVEGADVFEEFDPTADLPVQVDGLLNAIDLAATRDTLIQRFRNRGYPRADVSRSWSLPAANPYQADVTFEVETGPHSVFGPIALVGNEELDGDVIRQLLPFEEGQEYSEVRTLEAQRQSVLHRDDPARIDRRGGGSGGRRARQCGPTPGTDHRNGDSQCALRRGMEHPGVWEPGRALDEPKLLRRSETTPAPGADVQPGGRPTRGKRL